MPSKKDEKIPLSVVKKMPYKSLNRMLKKMREFLKKDETVQKMFKEYGVGMEEIDYIPMKFGNIDVSARTDHGVITFSYRLLTDGDFFKDFSYGTHEAQHWLDQCCSTKATQSANDGDYLHNKYEQKAFQKQIEYIGNNFGEDEAETYVDNLLEHHDKEGKEKKELKKTLMEDVKSQ